MSRPGFAGGHLVLSYASMAVVPAWPSSVARLRQAGCADGLEEPSVVEPVDPFEGSELDRLEVPPRSTAMDHLAL